MDETIVISVNRKPRPSVKILQRVMIVLGVVFLLQAILFSTGFMLPCFLTALCYFPMMKSTYAAAAVITFMNSWNAYMWPRTVMKGNSVQTMPMLIANMSNGYAVDYGMLMLGVLFCSLPTIIVFFVLQKQFAEGITGSVK